MVDVGLDRHGLPHIPLGLPILGIEGLFLIRQLPPLFFQRVHFGELFTAQQFIHSGPGLTQRCNTDDKTICELFFCLMDELDDITFSQSMRIIIDALMDTVMEYFHITEQQLEEFTASFIQRLPKYMQKALEFGSAAA